MTIISAGFSNETGKSDWIIGTDDRILVTGAGGFVGAKVVQILLEYGFKRLRCLVRSDRNISELTRMAMAVRRTWKLYRGIFSPGKTACKPSGTYL